MNNLTNSPQALYRFFDKNNRLLYVGISKAFVNRLNSHSFTADWFSQATTVTIEHFDSRSQVEAAEKHAIKRELPKYNKAHNPVYESHLKHWRELKKGLNSQKNIDEHRLLFSLKKEYEVHFSANKSTLFALKEIEHLWGGNSCKFCLQILHNRQYGNVSDSYFKEVYEEIRGEELCLL